MNDKKKLKRKLALYFVMLLLLAALLTFSGITLAWFYKGNDQVPADTLSGSIHAAYFNGGNGTVPSANATYKTESSTYPSYEFGGNDGPYQIDNATQLYNFAWLQYLGYFDDTTYFVLTDNINASSIVLPPIGTSDNPFVGYFDGNGYTISGLRVSNDITELNNTDVDGNKFNIPHQALENEELTDSAEIVGFFGVIGDNTETYPDIHNFTPTVKNVTLENATIETQTSTSLAGIAAGYVNGVMEEVVVSGTSTITNAENNVTSLAYTANLSDYALVGFCEEPYRKVLKVETVDVYEPNVELGSLGRLGDVGSGNAWGNSIDMESIYNELRNAYDAGTTATISNLSAKTVVHYNGTTVVTSTATATVTASSVNGYRLKTTKTTANGSEIASYALIQQEGIDDFVYLYGDKEIGTQNVSVTDIYKEDSLYINDGTNYLTTAPGNTTSSDNAGKWVFKSNGNGTYKIYTISNNTEQYLYKDANNTLSVGSTQGIWTIEPANDNKFVISIDGYTLCFKTDAWKLIPPAKNYITDSTMTNYLSVSNGNVVNQTNAGNAASWDKETVANGYMLKTVISGTTYYLKTDSGYNVVVTDNSAEATVWDEITANGNAKPKIHTVTGNTTEKALYYDGSIWKLVDYIIGSSGNDWGGSIDMLALYGRLLDIYDNYTSDSGNYKKQEITYLDSDGNTVNVKTSYVGDEGHYKGYYSPTEDYSYTFNRHPNATTKNFMYLYGELGSSIAAGTETIEHITMQQTDINANRVQITGKETINCFYIQCNGRYMTSSVGSTTSQADAALWQKEEIDDTSFYLYTTGGSTTRYLYAASTTNISVGNNKSRFYVDGNDQLYIRSGNTSYYLYYNTGGLFGWGVGWQMNTNPSDRSDLIPNTIVNNYAFSYDSSKNPRSVKNGSGSEWMYQANKLFTVFDNTVCYFTKNGSSFELTDEVLEPDTIDWFTDETGFYYVEDGTKFYLHLYPSLSISTEPQKLEVHETSAVSMTNVWKRVYDETTSRQTGTNGFPGSYMPLTVEDDIFRTSPLNTGYIVSGKKSAATNNYNGVTNETDYYGAGDIRVSKYAMTSISDHNVIYTINSSGKTSSQNVFNNFAKYEAAKAGLDEMLEKDSAWIYGLHFMNAAISRTSLVTLPKVTINGQTFQNYQVPQDCIDFNLKEAGYINFFAGTYFTGNKSFFSLHQITRNSNNAITGITEIKKIYRKTDGTYAYNTQPAGSTLVFDTDWISAPNTSAWQDNALYYFEIPVNEGEYALGSTNSNGAYLLYLDISANATVEGDSQFNVGETAEPVYKTDAGIVEKTVSSTESASIMTPPTYFPLTWDNGAVSSSNTGYIISGAHTNSDPPGDIRVSKYEKSYSSYWRGIGNSLTNGILTDSKIYTYKLGNNGGWQTISQYGTDNLYKYLNSKAQLQETIGSAATGDVYGLHFMDASIGTSNLITVPDATINGHTYTDYKMPRDSIDFNLKTPGYINVFAGTYFSGSSVNCFFSLHKIERSGSEITAINEVSKIYKAGSTYYYQFTDGSFSDSLPADYELLFDTACLKVRNDLESDSVYYFEIPVGAGEFAIGSVSGGNGGYLLYLDISTHQGDSVVKREKMVINTVEYELPKGVIFDGADRTVFEVPITMTGDIEFTVNNGTVNATSPLTASSASSVKTIEKVTVSDQVGEFSIKRTTEGGNVTYEYSKRPLNVNDSIEELSAYFNSSINNVIFTYNYLLEGSNSVNNTSGDTEYSTDVGFAITKYEITARAIVEAVTATVQAIDSGASYIEFNGVTSIQTSQTITIPT